MVLRNEKEQERLKSLETYTSEDRYKVILRDSFFTISYSLGLSLSVAGLALFIAAVLPIPELKRFLIILTATVFFSAGWMLLQLFVELSRTFNPIKSLTKKKSKIEALEKEKDLL
ncbi:hypothetical protein [Methylobacter sp.]|uniref:hypothetical protein n=1 Tax=Methylobacter sp. TaxID=2051955 RepID=UPI00122A92EF|nr:hypothetical protein [Methylobacter sp.]TAK62332.1 MAG: hypothetical protein EPO18_11055 [Methylobacter sp.]